MQPDYVYKEMSELEIEYRESMFLVTLAFMLASQPHHFLHLDFAALERIQNESHKIRRSFPRKIQARHVKCPG